LFAGIVLIGDVRGGIAMERERPTVPHEPARNVLAIYTARPEMALIDVKTRKVASPWPVAGEGQELFFSVDPAVPIFPGGVDADLVHLGCVDAA
jgi:hypothetical protein